VGAAIVWGMDAAPVLESAEHDFDLVALAVEGCIMRDGCFAVDLREDARGDIARGERLAEPVGVIASAADQQLGLEQCLQHQGSSLVVAHLPFAQQHDARAVLGIADSMQRGVQASDTSGYSPFLNRLAAVR